MMEKCAFMIVGNLLLWLHVLIRPYYYKETEFRNEVSTSEGIIFKQIFLWEKYSVLIY
jgi:uncharacterized membrane protein